MKTRLNSLLLAMAVIGSAGASAQYPNKPVRMVVPFPAGGPTDTLARNLGVAMGETLKQQMIIENSGGAGGTIGINKVAKARPDGYTILLMHVGISTAPALYRNLPYDTVNDLEPIGRVADVPMTLVAKRSLPPDNLKEFLAYAKANKDKLTYGNAGPGSSSHLCGLLFMSAIQVSITTVSYKGNAPALTDLIGGQIDLMCDLTTSTTQQIKAGTMKTYGVTSKTRVASLPMVPTLEEQGLKGFEVNIWFGLWAPKGTPRPALDKLNIALQAAVKDTTFKTRLANVGAEPVPVSKATPDSLHSFLKTEIDKWGPIIKKAGVYAE